MTSKISIHDIIIIGGGLSGLTLAIRLSQKGHDVLLLEKKTYPFHRVCGEYISNESLPYLKRLGFDPFDFGAQQIDKLQISTPSGYVLNSKLEMGAFGLSRFVMDQALYNLAESCGSTILEQQNVIGVEQKLGFWEVETADNEIYKSRIVIGAQGKRSTIDSTMGRSFMKKRTPYMGVKYHIRYDQPSDLIALHNFLDGYCGISRIEDDKFCLCYLAHNGLVKKHGSIKAAEKSELSKNPHLKRIFSNAEFLFEKPVVINEISFVKKPLVDNGVIMCGDAAGMIAPLSGNGMSMAIHSAKLLADALIEYLEGKVTHEKMLNDYQVNWEKEFGKRLWTGRQIQKLFGAKLTTEISVRSINNLRPLKRKLISLTHGHKF